MPHVFFFRWREQIARDRTAGEFFNFCFGSELFRSTRHDNTHFDIFCPQLANQIRCFDGGNRAADYEQYGMTHEVLWFSAIYFIIMLIEYISRKGKLSLVYERFD